MSILIAACQTLPNESQNYYEPVAFPKLEDELDTAKKELVSLQKRIEQLNEELAHHQLRSIKKTVRNFNPEKAVAEVPELFSKERKILNDIINSQPTLSQFAQETLDDILMLITHLSDKKEV